VSTTALPGIFGLWAKFLAFNALGAVLWVGTWSAVTRRVRRRHAETAA
jgi:membrane protein DedA with SNARE-associated domain